MRKMHPNRLLAKQNDEVRFVGDICISHPDAKAVRYTCNNACVVCALERVKKYQLQNPAVIKQRAAEYNQCNKELLSANHKSWRALNAEHDAERKVRYRTANLAQVKAAYKLYYEANYPRMLAKRNRQHADKLKRTPSWLTCDDHWMIEQAYELAGLRTKMFGFPWHVDHVIPLRGKKVSGLHVPTNLQVVAWADNLKKTNKFEVA